MREAARGWWIVRSAVVGLAMLGAGGCAGVASETSDHREGVQATVETGTSETKIYGGALDNDEAAVGSVVALKVGAAGEYELCSGTLVAPNVVLTARHCVANSITTAVACDENGKSTNGKHVDGDQPATAVGVYVGASPKFSGKPDAVGSAIFAPSGEYLCDSDIALVVLSTALANVEPVAVRLGSNAGIAPGEKIRSVGYGQNDSKLPLGTRLRKPGVEILAMGKGVSESKTALGAHEFEVGTSICQGDSGGPALSEDTGAVIGVVSRGGDCTEDFGHIYTATAGWSELFTRAFAVAGGAPIIEAGSPVGPETKALPVAVRTPIEPTESPAPAAASCSSAPGHAGALHGGASVGLLLACALVLRARRARA